MPCKYKRIGNTARPISASYGHHAAYHLCKLACRSPGVNRSRRFSFNVPTGRARPTSPPPPSGDLPGPGMTVYGSPAASPPRHARRRTPPDTHRLPSASNAAASQIRRATTRTDLNRSARADPRPEPSLPRDYREQTGLPSRTDGAPTSSCLQDLVTRHRGRYAPPTEPTGFKQISLPLPVLGSSFPHCPLA